MNFEEFSADLYTESRKLYNCIIRELDRTCEEDDYSMRITISVGDITTDFAFTCPVAEALIQFIRSNLAEQLIVDDITYEDPAESITAIKNTVCIAANTLDKLNNVAWYRRLLNKIIRKVVR